MTPDAGNNSDAARPEAKKVIVTGAAGRLGGWIARIFAQDGAALWLVDKDEAGLKAAASEFEAGQPVKTSRVDLSEAREIEDLHEEVAAAWGAPDILINNAGLYPSKALLDVTAADWDSLMAVNLRAVQLMTRASTCLMIDHGVAGAVVNIISRSARIPRTHSIPYAVSKAAVEMLTRGYAMELARHGIRVNAVSPGLIPGGTASELGDHYVEAANANIPLGRFSGPADAPLAIRFLCSDEASFITGTSIFVDGGSTAGDLKLPPQTDPRDPGSRDSDPRDPTAASEKAGYDHRDGMG